MQPVKKENLSLLSSLEIFWKRSFFVFGEFLGRLPTPHSASSFPDCMQSKHHYSTPATVSFFKKSGSRFCIWRRPLTSSHAPLLFIQLSVNAEQNVHKTSVFPDLRQNDRTRTVSLLMCKCSANSVIINRRSIFNAFEDRRRRNVLVFLCCKIVWYATWDYVVTSEFSFFLLNIIFDIFPLVLLITAC